MKERYGGGKCSLLILIDHPQPCRNFAIHRTRSLRTVRQAPFAYSGIAERASCSAFSLYRYWTPRYHKAVRRGPPDYKQEDTMLTIASMLCDSEWITHQHRDTYASIIGHPPLLSYVSVADGESIGRAKFEMCEVSCSERDALPFP